jgi:HEAT repeat protein
MSKDNEIEALIELLETTQNDYTLRIAAESLEKICTGNPKAIDALIKVLETTQNVSFLWIAVESLVQWGVSKAPI